MLLNMGLSHMLKAPGSKPPTIRDAPSPGAFDFVFTLIDREELVQCQKLRS